MTAQAPSGSANVYANRMLRYSLQSGRSPRIPAIAVIMPRPIAKTPYRGGTARRVDCHGCTLSLKPAWRSSSAILAPPFDRSDQAAKASAQVPMTKEGAMTGKLLDAFLSDMDSLGVSVGGESPGTTSIQMPSPVKPPASFAAGSATKSVPDDSKKPKEPQVQGPKTSRPQLRRRSSLHVEIGASMIKPVGLKRCRSTSESAAPKGIEMFDVLARMLNVDTDNSDSSSPDDVFNHRWTKVPKLDVRSPWLSACGFMPGDEKIALPLLFNQRLPYEPKKDEQLFASLEQSARSQLLEVESVLRSEGLGAGVTKGRFTSVKPTGEFGPFLTFSSAKTLPFSLDIIHETAHQLIDQAELELPHGGKLPSDIIFIKKQYFLRSDNSGEKESDSLGIPVLLRCALLLVKLDDTLFGAWSGTGEWPAQIKRLHPTCAPIREKGWVLARACKNSSSRSLVHSCLHVTPGLLDDEVAKSQSYLDELSAVTGPSYEKLLLEREQMFENKFMDVMLARRFRR